MITILLYGHLGRQFGRVHARAVKSAAEAVRALCVTLPGFRQALVDGGAYRVLVGGREAIDRDQLGDPLPLRKTFRIVPVVQGAGKGMGKIILGAALIFAAPYVGTLASGLGLGGVGPPTAFGLLATKAVGALGWAMVSGGIAQALSPTPKAQTVEPVSNRPSYAFNGAVNTVTQGNPVPVCYGGPIIVGSQVISAGLFVEQLS